MTPTNSRGVSSPPETQMAPEPQRDRRVPSEGRGGPSETPIRSLAQVAKEEEMAEHQARLARGPVADPPREVRIVGDPRRVVGVWQRQIERQRREDLQMARADAAAAQLRVITSSRAERPDEGWGDAA